jgi:hypothetical protein
MLPSVGLSPLAMHMSCVFKRAGARDVALGDRADLAGTTPPLDVASDHDALSVEESEALLTFFRLLARWEREGSASNGN